MVFLLPVRSGRTTNIRVAVFLFISMVIGVFPLSGQQKIDSLQSVIKTAEDDTNKVNTLIKLGKEYERAGDYESAMKNVNEALELSDDLGYDNGIAQSYHTMGGFYYNQGNFRESRDMFTLALEVRTRQGNKTGMAMLYNNIGQVNNQLGESGIALENFAEAVKLNKETGDKHRLADNYNNIGVNYYNRGEVDKGLENQLEAKRLKEEIGETDDAKYAVIVGNVAMYYCDKHDFDKGLEMAEVALKTCLEIGETGMASAAYNTIGSANYNKGLLEKDSVKREQWFSEALKNFGLALELKNEEENLEWAAILHQNTAKVYIEQNKFEAATRELRIGLEQAKESGTMDVIANIHGILAQCDSAAGDFRSAFENYRLYKQYSDSIFNMKNAEKIAEMSARFETEKNQEKVVALENDKQRTRIFFAVFVALALVGLFFAYRAYRNKKKVAEFEASESHRKEVLLEEVNHRINNNLQIISSLLSLQANSADDEKLKEYLRQSQNRIQSLASLHELLFMNDASLKVDMKDYLGKVLDYHKDILSTRNGKVDVVMNVGHDRFPTQVAVPLALIVNELVVNSLKYAFADGKDGKLHVTLSRPQGSGENWLLRVSDTGKGLPADDQYRKDSLGLRLVNLMTKQIKGTLSKSNSPGATFEIAFKLPA